MTAQASAPDGKAIVGLYDRYGVSLFRYALMLLADAPAAEDAVHEVFAAMLRTGVVTQLEADERYLRRAIRNECFSVLRRRATRRQAPGEPGALLERIAAVSENPDEHLALERGLRQLSPAQREIVYLHAFEGRTFREVADAAGISLNTVAARYRYALARLRGLLNGTGTGHARPSRR